MKNLRTTKMPLKSIGITMKIEAYAKINLTLEVLGRRVDGYHALRSLVAPISLADTLEIEITDNGVIESDTGYGEKDLIVKAAKLLQRDRAVGARIRVTKRIPTGGGLGGGSADAAAILLALNELWSLGHLPEELAEIGAQVGSDVPALVLAQYYREVVLMEGRGEKVSRIPQTSTSTYVVLVNPGVHSSTPEVFGAFRESTYPKPLNDLQQPAIALHPEIGACLCSLEKAGAKDVLMSGSGATVFGFAENETEGERIVREMKNHGFLAWSVHTL